jgi:two-component sensor histidine kinase
MRRTAFLIISLVFAGISAGCQPTAGSLDVPGMTDTTPVTTLLGRLDRLPADSVADSIHSERWRDECLLLLGKELMPAVESESQHNIFSTIFFAPSEVVVGIAKFDVRRGRNREALALLLPAIHNPSMAREAEDRRMMELLLFQVYLALGDTRQALSYHTRYVTLNDSIFNVEKLKQFQTLQVRYETRQKEQSLKLLQLQNQKEQVQLRETGLQRNVTLGAVVLLLILSVVAWRGYQLKQLLVEEKDRLLKDKDLLMQEIHHRVKNSLNIIISLLESQSHYLNNSAAQAALQDTQNRIQAVFLLHQKLYRASAGTAVDATGYVLELMNHLCETFDTYDHNITITYKLEPIFLDAFEVLPLGVILNEGITNAIKHAFPGNRSGCIEVSLRRRPSGDVQLQIRDNGIGLPAGFRYDGDKSLGFALFDGLVKQLHGGYSIEDKGGVTMTVQFKPRSPFKPEPAAGSSVPGLSEAGWREDREQPDRCAAPGQHPANNHMQIHQ